MKFNIPTIKKITYKELRKLDENELREAVQYANDKAYRRMILAKKRLSHPEYAFAYNDKGTKKYTFYKNIDTSALTKGQLIHEMIRIRNFLNLDTSTAGEFNRLQNKILSKIEKETQVIDKTTDTVLIEGVKLNADDLPFFWDVMNVYREKISEKAEQHYEAHRNIAEAINSGKYSDLTAEELGTLLRERALKINITETTNKKSKGKGLHKYDFGSKK